MLKQLRRRLFYPVMVALLLLQGCVTVPPAATISKQLEKVAPSPKPETPPARPYVFSWMFVDSNSMRVRGGTTNGGSIQTSATPVLGWLRLQEATDEQRDRAAILAMAGEYRVSFDFIEKLNLGFLLKQYSLDSIYSIGTFEKITTNRRLEGLL